METELKTAIWQIANAAIEMHEGKLNGKEFEELAINARRQVKNLNIPCVINPVCPLCGDTGFYSFGGSFGGAVQTVRCHCGANGL